MTPSATRRRRKRVLSALAGLTLALLLAELACRSERLFPGERFEPAGARSFLEARAEVTRFSDLSAFAAPDPEAGTPDLRPVPQPYVGFTDPQHVALSEEGARWFAGPEAATTFDVLILGGSFAAQFANAATGILATELADEPRVGGRPVRVWNAGRAAYRQPQPLHLLSWLLSLGWRPDLVVCIDGFNEVAMAVSNAEEGSHALFPSLTYWGTVARGGDVDIEAIDIQVRMRTAQFAIRARAQRALGLGVWRSALLTRLSMAWLAGPREEFQAARRDYVAHLSSRTNDLALGGPAGPRAEAGAVALAVEGWRESTLSLAGMCAAREIACLDVLQPTLHDAGSKPWSEDERRRGAAPDPWGRGARAGYPLLRAACAELAATGAPVHDASRVFAAETDTLYVDFCHLNREGYERFARAIVPRLRAVLAPAASDAAPR